MSLCRIIQVKLLPVIERFCKSLPRHASLNLCNKETTLYTFLSAGSYTLEAAVVLPLIAGLLASILLIFRVMQVQLVIQDALTYASRKTAAEACLENTAASYAVAEAVFRNRIKDEVWIEQYITGGCYGIHLLESDLADDYIDLRATYDMKFPVGFWSVKGVAILQESKSRKWTGLALNSVQEDPLVYITSYGTVYHSTKSCPFLDLTIRSVDSAKIQELRNQDGSKYRKCELCAAKNTSKNNVYITDYGTYYHTDIMCSALKRSIQRVHLSEVGNRNACLKCKGK